MRILRVISSMDPSLGGPSQGIRNSIPELRKIGVENEVVCLDAPEANFLGKDPFIIHAIGQRKGPWSYHKDLIPWLLDNFKRFDVVIIHGLWLYHGHAVCRAIKKFRKSNTGKAPQLYVMPHGMLDPYFQKEKGRKLKAIRNWVYWKLIESRVINSADGVLFTCEEELRLAGVPFRPYHPKKKINIGYGTRAPEAQNEKMNNAFRKYLEQPLNDPYFLFLSRIHPKKGVDILVEAYLQYSQRNSSFPKLVIAGPGLDTTFGEKVLAKANGSPGILFPGMLTGDAKWGAFYGCEAFILPSHQENFGIAVTEALACSKPVMISDQVNIWREIKEGNGGIIQQDSLQGIIKMFEEWESLTAEQKEKMKQNAATLFTEHFSMSKMANNIKQLLHKN